MDKQTKIKIGAAVVVLLIVIYMMIGMFSSGTEEPPKMKPNPDIPKPGELMPAPPKPAQQSAAAAESSDAKLLALQTEAQARYMTALNELQMLKINKDIAEANKAIMKAKEDTVTSQVKIVTLLTPPAPPAPPAQVEQKPVNPGLADVSLRGVPPAPAQPKNDDMSVVSVTNIRGRWMAVINGGKALYKVTIGDTIPDEESTVVSIDRSGVTVEKDGTKRKIYMNSVI